MTSPQGGELNVRHTWFVGGSLLLGSVVLGWNLQSPGPLATVVSILGTVLFSTSVLVFAFGFRRSESVTVRRPLGTAALTFLAVWVLLSPVVSDLLASGSTDDDLPSALLVYGVIDPYIRFALALVSVIHIGRAGVVPVPFHWLPAWTLAALTVPWILGQIVAAGPSPESDLPTILFIAAVDGLVRTAGAVVLSVVAILLSDRARRTARDPLGAGIGA
jgi:hypothetical protein